MAYKHFIYLEQNFPDRIKKARENKVVEKDLDVKSTKEEDTQVLLVKTNLLPKKLTHKGKH